jgi:hypothetical protein
MRLVGTLVIVILIALAAVLYLQRESATSSFRAVRTIATDLREEGVAGRRFEPELATRMASSMQELIDHPEGIADHRDELATIAATAASWAEAAPSPSVALSVAVALRAAAADLRGYQASSTVASLGSAQRNLDRARAALAGEPIGASPVDAVRDRLDNLQSGQQERAQEVDEEMNQ